MPPPNLGAELAQLLESGAGADVEFSVGGERMPAHKIVLQARSPVFRALLTGPMREGHEASVEVVDVQPPVFRALLAFAYTDALPEELQVGGYCRQVGGYCRRVGGWRYYCIFGVG